jgi:hypothetical protein
LAGNSAIFEELSINYGISRRQFAQAGKTTGFLMQTGIKWGFSKISVLEMAEALKIITIKRTKRMLSQKNPQR